MHFGAIVFYIDQLATTIVKCVDFFLLLPVCLSDILQVVKDVYLS